MHDPLTEALAAAGREPWWVRVMLARVDWVVRWTVLLAAGGALYVMAWNDGQEALQHSLACLPPAKVSRPSGRVP